MKGLILEISVNATLCAKKANFGQSQLVSALMRKFKTVKFMTLYIASANSATRDTSLKEWRDATLSARKASYGRPPPATALLSKSVIVLSMTPFITSARPATLASPSRLTEGRATSNAQ